MPSSSRSYTSNGEFLLDDVNTNCACGYVHVVPARAVQNRRTASVPRSQLHVAHLLRSLRIATLRPIPARTKMRRFVAIFYRPFSSFVCVCVCLSTIFLVTAQLPWLNFVWRFGLGTSGFYLTSLGCCW